MKLWLKKNSHPNGSPKKLADPSQMMANLPWPTFPERPLDKKIHLSLSLFPRARLPKDPESFGARPKLREVLEPKEEHRSLSRGL